MADQYGLEASGIDPEIAAQMLGLKGKRAVAQAMLEQSLGGIKQPQTPSRGFTPRTSPLEAIASVLETYMNKKNLEGIDKEQAGLMTDNKRKVADALTGYEQKRAGTPSQSIPDAGPGDAVDSSTVMAGQKGDPQAAIRMALGNPLIANNPAVKMDYAAQMEANKPRVLGRTLVDGQGNTLATDSTWAAEQAAAKDAKDRARIDAQIAKEQAQQVAIQAQKDRDTQRASDRAFQIGLMQQGKPGFGQPKLTKGQEATDREFGKEYAQYQAGGGSADVEKQLTQLDRVAKELGEPSNDYTGSLRGLVPDKIRATTNPKAVAAKNAVEEVAQRNLRMVLGAQFTQVEGERLIARAYNDQMSPVENKRRVEALSNQIRTAAKTKEDAARYFEENGTLTGWKGRMPTLSDFESAIDNADKTPSRRASDKSTVRVVDW